MAKLKSAVLQAQKAYQALELWKRWFEYSGDDPYERSHDDAWARDCFFCCADYPNHDSDCIYLVAKELITD